MKKFISLILCLTLVFSFAACSSNGSADETTAASQTDTAADTDATASAGSLADSQGDSKVLIAYFAVAENSAVDAVSSASVLTTDGQSLGLVQALAGYIQENTGGTLFPFRPPLTIPRTGTTL